MSKLDMEAGSEPVSGLRSGILADDEAIVNDISLRAVDSVDISVQQLSLEIDVSPHGLLALKSLFHKKTQPARTFKTILHEINAWIPSGSLTAIIGGTGSGKTSMLNALAHKTAGTRLKTSGSIFYNGKSRISSIRSAYVMQHDVLIPTLTVKETLLYAAELRLPPPTTAAERLLVVEDIILELGLKECANTRIGNNVHRGCSGGEKRRTSLGVQMLANPSVLFLDEVTTGLDATSAFQLIRTLKNLAEKGRTIIVTIHQPRSEIWGLFDHLILLSGGVSLYSGTVQDCLPYFASLGYPLPPFINPAEHLVDLAAIDTRSPELEVASVTRVDGLKQNWRKQLQNQIRGSKGEKSTASTQRNEQPPQRSRSTAVSRQVRVLTQRTLKVTIRDPLGVISSLVEAIAMGVLMGWIFFSLDGSLAGIRSREGAVYTASALQGYIILLFEAYRLTRDIEVFDREHGEGVVGVPAFLISRRLARTLIEDLPVPLIFSIIFYFMVGFRPVASQFFIFLAVNILSHYVAITFATVCVAASRNFAGASLIANMGYTIQSLGCGYFVQANQIPVYMRWLKWTAYVFYAFGALASNEFIGHASEPQGHLYDCPVPGDLENPACKEYTGQYIIESLGFPTNWIVRPIIILLAYVIALYFGAGLILQFWKVEMGVSRAQKTDSDASAGKERMTTHSLDEVRTVHVSLHNYSLDIEKWNKFKKKSEISILKPVTASFEPGVLNVIMGPSGSGKTSLLNLMACRLANSMTTKYQKHGEMLFNGAVPSEGVIRSICGYVLQDDDSLLPYLTVRENLHFAAGLRLPTYLSKEEKIQRAEAVLLKMGLRDCADNLVGNALVKGISGGEKRRVTISIQILTEPRVLILDEPTSGLDAFTATSIIDVLRGLADEGRTLILTIHQSRSDLFKHFGNILLLARGGYPVFAGKGSQMLPHFASLGYECPVATNPADFALDLITVNLQHSAKEIKSREKVRSLISSWADASPSILRTSSHIATPAELGSLARAVTPFHVAFPLLLRRSFINFRRNPPSIIARTTQVMGFCVILTLFFAPLKSDYYSVQSRVGFIQEFAALYFVGMLQNVAVYPDEKQVFYSEHDDNAYSVEAFFLQYTAAEIPFEILTSLLFALLTVLAAGLPRSATLFFVIAFNIFAVVSCGESIGIIFNTIVSHTGFAVSLTSIVLSIATIMGGVISLDIPPFLQAFNHLSPIKWSVGNLAPYSLRGVVFTCTEFQRLESGKCPIERGEDVLRLYRLDGNARVNVLALGVCVVAYRALGYLVLKAKRSRWSVWQGKKGQKRLKGKEIENGDEKKGEEGDKEESESS